ncbi:PREDICTED: acyl carrier protein 4, chloroplastic-like [Tarenaya hassleriana]|uniref:acyl carrier protein 4, chloroplastic-like n=1 Tax=Tarenaya hassleriana TaxID=28532 RepID=UPI00053C3DA6|nr:PREDICTED: acyl carrier protein 4, chloroplastic-like [Tarenaya hassleriana]
MASLSATCLTFKASSMQPDRISKVLEKTLIFRSVSFGFTKGCCFPSSKNLRLQVSSAAKAETVQRVCDIVREQLALPADSQLTPESKFSALGADSLDTVEIVMTLEEQFEISVDESDAQDITTIQEAADLIEQLAEKKPEAS